MTVTSVGTSIAAILNPYGDSSGKNKNIDEKRYVREYLDPILDGHLDLTDASNKIVYQDKNPPSDQRVDPKLLSDDLKPYYRDYKKKNNEVITWGKLSQAVHQDAWKKFDDSFEAMTKGDFSSLKNWKEKLWDSGKNTSTEFGKMNPFKGTAGAYLKKMQAWLKDHSDRFKKDTTNIGDVIDYVSDTVFNENPTNEKELLKDFESVANGFDADAKLAEIVNGGNVRDANGKKITKDSKVNWDLFPEGGALDKKLGKDADRKNMTYGKLLDLVQGHTPPAFTYHPANEKELIEDFDSVVNTNSYNDCRQLYSIIEQKKLKDADGKPITYDSKIAWEFLPSGGALDKKLGKDADRKNMTYRDLLHLVDVDPMEDPNFAMFEG